MRRTHPPLRYRLALTSDPMTIRVPRKLVELALHNWNLDHLASAATVIVSELATNTLKVVPGTEIEVGVSLDDTWLRIEVWDESPVIPSVPADLALELEQDAEGGRGLWVVSHMADKFGIDTAPSVQGHGKTIWAMLQT